MSKTSKIVGRYCRSQSGGMAIAFGVTVSVILMGVAVALDFNRLSSTRMTLRDMADAAALAGANVAETDPANRMEIVQQMLIANNFGKDSSLKVSPPTIVFNDETREVSVVLDADIDLLLMGIVGTDKLEVAGKSVASYQGIEIEPVSISFALDVSGSMRDVTSDGRSKIDVLKTATAELFDAIESGTPRPDLLTKSIRSGMTAYNTEVVAEFPMDYGWSGLESDVNDLVAGGGTNSTPALLNSYNQLKNDPVQPENLRRFVIFMTDGDNNDPVWDEESAALCAQMRDEGIEIFSVAFDAPDKGQYLLVDCASPNGAGKNNGNGMGTGTGMGNGNAYAYGHYKNKKDLEDKKKDKKEHYFDAADAKAFEEAFRAIGDEIGELNIVIKG